MTPADGRTEAPASALRRLDTASAVSLADLAAAFEDLQTVLRCCERLVSALADGDGDPDDIVVEAVWTTALLSYGRCFSARKNGPTLTDDDVAATHPAGDVLGWHRVLLELRQHYADPVANPRERFSVGVALTADGTPGGVAITSARQPLVDDLTVRQTGAIAFALSHRLDERLAAQQEAVMAELRQPTAGDLARLPELDVAVPPES